MPDLMYFLCISSFNPHKTHGGWCDFCSHFRDKGTEAQGVELTQLANVRLGFEPGQFASSQHFFFKSRWNSHSIKLTILKWTIQWHLIYSQCCTTTISMGLQNIFFVTPKRNPIPTGNHPPFPHPPAPGNHKSTFCLYGFTDSGHFLYMESCNTWSFVSGFFHFA